MKNILKIYSKKIVALTLMCLTILSPLTGVANASPKHGAPPPKQVQHINRGYKNRPVIHHPVPMRHEVHHTRPAPHYVVHHDNHHDRVGVLIGGLILGTIIGAAIADAE